MGQRFLFEGNRQHFMSKHLVHEQMLLFIIVLHQSHIGAAKGAQHPFHLFGKFHFLSFSFEVTENNFKFKYCSLKLMTWHGKRKSSWTVRYQQFQSWLSFEVTENIFKHCSLKLITWHGKISAISKFGWAIQWSEEVLNKRNSWFGKGNCLKLHWQNFVLQSLVDLQVLLLLITDLHSAVGAHFHNTPNQLFSSLSAGMRLKKGKWYDLSMLGWYSNGTCLTHILVDLIWCFIVVFFAEQSPLQLLEECAGEGYWFQDTPCNPKLSTNRYELYCNACEN